MPDATSTTGQVSPACPSCGDDNPIYLGSFPELREDAWGCVLCGREFNVIPDDHKEKPMARDSWLENAHYTEFDGPEDGGLVVHESDEYTIKERGKSTGVSKDRNVRARDNGANKSGKRRWF